MKWKPRSAQEHFSFNLDLFATRNKTNSGQKQRLPLRHWQWSQYRLRHSCLLPWSTENRRILWWALGCELNISTLWTRRSSRGSLSVCCYTVKFEIRFSSEQSMILCWSLYCLCSVGCVTWMETVRGNLIQSRTKNALIKSKIYLDHDMIRN